MTDASKSSITNDITISKATISDMKELLDWRIEVLTEVFSLPADADRESLRNENERYYRTSIPTNGHIACFAKLNSETIGCGGVCVYQEMPSPDNPSGWCAYLMNIYVRKQFRRHRIGMKIVQFLIDEVKQRGITKIYLETSTPGKPLYAKMGFEDLKDMMILKH